MKRDKMTLIYHRAREVGW